MFLMLVPNSLKDRGADKDWASKIPFSNIHIGKFSWKNDPKRRTWTTSLQRGNSDRQIFLYQFSKRNMSRDGVSMDVSENSRGLPNIANVV